ncbi:MAG: ABC transporter ATP-binding protein [Candidatus Sericytochromatia bacterium]
MIHLEGIKKTYGQGDMAVHALKGVDLDIHPGEFVAVMGASGSGKSTLMNVIGCLDRPDAGRYALDGRDVSRLDAAALADIRNQLLGFVFQSFNLLSRTSAQENVELPLVYAGVGAKERRERAQEALRRVGLAERAHHHPNQLSGGQQQRVAIARAIVTRPRVIVADEPTGALDSKTSAEIMHLFQELGATGITVVLVTHEADVAAYAGRLLIMKDGELESDKAQAPRRDVPETAS